MRYLSLLILTFLWLFSSAAAVADEAQWTADMKAGVAAWERQDYDAAEQHLDKALGEAERLGFTELHITTKMQDLVTQERNLGTEHEQVKKTLISLTITAQSGGPWVNIDLFARPATLPSTLS